MQSSLVSVFVFISMLTAGAGTAFAQQPGAPPAAPAKPATPAQPRPPRSRRPPRSPAPAAEPPDKAKISYALGMDLGTQLRKQSVEIDPDVFSRALRAALGGSTTEMTADEARGIITAFQLDIRRKQAEAMAKSGEKNRQEGEAFLAANKAKPGVVTLPSGLQYKIVKEGTGPKPTTSDTVVCHYRGRLIDGTEFDSSYRRGEPAAFPVGGVIKGWTEALQLMPVGSTWELYVPSSLAYGERGAGGQIGPNSTLIFSVELISIKGK